MEANRSKWGEVVTTTLPLLDLLGEFFSPTSHYPFKGYWVQEIQEIRKYSRLQPVAPIYRISGPAISREARG